MKSPNFDGVVPISHTELGRDMKANNVELVTTLVDSLYIQT